MDDKFILQRHLNNAFNEYSKNIAIEKSDIKITYDNLNIITNKIANHLRRCNVLKGSNVVVISHDKISMIYAMIGIMKAGCVYIPIDENYPIKLLERMSNIVDIDYVLHSGFDENSDIPLLLNNIRNINIDELLNTVDDNNDIKDIIYYGEDKIYIYFTSGTTGMPKAILGKNESLLQFILWEIKEFALDESLKASQLTSASHDPYLRDIFVPLLSGGTICIPYDDNFLQPDKLTAWLDKFNVTLIHCTPSIFKVICSHTLSSKNFTELKYIMLAGEKLKPWILKPWYEIFYDRIQIVNLYGPTETTLAKLFYRIKPTDVNLESIPIGKSIDYCRVIILDNQMNVSDFGEIYIRTKYMSLGYYNQPDETSKSFIQNPFLKQKDIIYKTGDIGRLQSDGNVVFCGRNDKQIKLRGIRIELEEIEKRALKFDGIIDCLVEYKGNELKEKSKHVNNNIIYDEQFIVIYYTTANEIDEYLFKFYLKQYLPNHMIPSYFIKIEEIPLNKNGKIDYDRLPNLIESQDKIHIEARTETEKRVVEIWKKIIDVNKISVTDSFMNIGGNSLNILNLISNIYNEFNVELSLEDLFNESTVEVIAKYIDRALSEKNNKEGDKCG